MIFLYDGHRHGIGFQPIFPFYFFVFEFVSD